MTEKLSITALRGRILHSVSRSFYLSIFLLPAKIRDPIALAYLLARATDTMADTAGISAELRRQELAKLAAMIQRDHPPESFENFATLQHDPAERTLIEAIPNCLRWLDSMASGDQADIRSVLASINQGQTLDLERFSDPARVTELERASDLERYTYLVAGCVGEFWTSVCFRNLPQFSQESQAWMNVAGVEYGKGLQLVNVLRDVGTDLRAGRCYLPAEELHSLGVTPCELNTAPARAEPILNAWREKAERGIAAGIDYSCAILPWRVRLATVLPALIGARTLALLRKAGPAVFERKIKVSRAEVRRIVFGVTRTVASPRSLRDAFQKLSC